MAHYGGVATGVNSSAHWLIERASQSLKENNTYEAKAWLITAKTLYPKDFGVQYEAYRIEKNAARVQESAKLFCEMFQQFPDRSILWEEVASFTEALEGNVEDHHVKFLTALFSSIPHHAQREILLKAAGRCKDCIEKCRMMLLLMRRFPDVIPKNGVMLTEMLTYAEDSEYPCSPVNPYRKLLVCDVLPHLLASENISLDSTRGADSQDDEDCSSGISHQQVYKWFELSIEFYVSCATTQNQMTEDSRDHQSYIDTSIVAEVLDGKGPWVVLHEHFHLVAKKCGWNEICRIQERIDPQFYRNIGDYWSSITELHHKLKKITKHNTVDDRSLSDVPEKTGVMFATIILFLQTVWEYCSTVNRCDVPAAAPGSVPLLVLIEESSAETTLASSTTSLTQATGDDSSPVPKKKKRKGSCGECGSPVKEDSKNKPFVNIIIDKSCGAANSSLSKDFAIAVDAWHILNTHADYKSRFCQLSSDWNVDQWQWMSAFKVDRLLYKGKYKKGIEVLQEERLCLEQDSSSNQELLLRGTVQLSCCYFHLGDHKRACEEALYALHFFARREVTEENVTLKRSTTHVQGKLDSCGNESAGQPSTCSGRCFRLIQCNEVEVLSFSVRLILSSLKQRLATEGRNDQLLGHVIVLLQFGWPREERTFYQLVDTIRSQGGLKYRSFFNYVNNIDILEEFAHLNSDDSYHLDLLPQSTCGTSRAVTRGVNKGAKEEFRAAMERQVRRSEETLEPLLKAFFQEERNSLLNGSHY